MGLYVFKLCKCAHKNKKMFCFLKMLKITYARRRGYSLSARILHRAPPPAPSGPKFSYSENSCGSENAIPPKIFWDMEGHRGHFR